MSEVEFQGQEYDPQAIWERLSELTDEELKNVTYQSGDASGIIARVMLAERREEQDDE